MIAYTAWDSLRAIAQQYDADLRLDAEARIALSPHRVRFVSPAPARRLVERARRGLAMLQAATGSRA